MPVTDAVSTIPFVDLKTQYSAIRDEIDAAVARVIADTAFVGGPFVKVFENEFARYCGVRHCVSVGNGTDALFIALKTLGVGPGDEVVTAANTFVATSEAITMTGAKVVFADIDPVTFNIDTDRLVEKLTPRTKAVVPVHLYGHPAEMESILHVAERHGLFVVSDAAQAHGAQYMNEPVTRLGDISCFSFYPGKNLGAYGDGGALVTDSDEWAHRARMFANHGRVKKYDHDFEGVNSRLDGLQAAVLSVKLRHLDAWTEARRRSADRYREHLGECDLMTPQEATNVRAVYHLFVVRVPEGRRDALYAHLKNDGISTGIHYPIALPYLNAYRHLGHSEADFPEALRASKEILSLPIFPELTESQVERVAASVQAAPIS